MRSTFTSPFSKAICIARKYFSQVFRDEWLSLAILELVSTDMINEQKRRICKPIRMHACMCFYMRMHIGIGNTPFVIFEIFYLHSVHEEILLVDVEHTQRPLRRHLNLTIGVKEKRHAVSAQTMPHLITLVFLGILDYSGAITRRREHTQRNGLRLHSSVPVLLSAQIPWQHDKPLSAFYYLLKSLDIPTSLIRFIFAPPCSFIFIFLSFFQLCSFVFTLPGTASPRSFSFVFAVIVCQCVFPQCKKEAKLMLEQPCSSK